VRSTGTRPARPPGDELDEYIDEHAAEFASYEAEGEQQLGWHGLHLQYVALVEGQIHQFLSQLGAQPDSLYALLSEAAGGDARADAFLERLLGMGDYHHFCAAMRGGGGGLKLSNLDLQRLSGGRQVDFASALAARYSL